MPSRGQYRVILCDLRSDQLLDVLPARGVSFDDAIGRTGSCSGSIDVTDSGVAKRIRANLIPARTAVYVVRGREVWWGGVLWTITPKMDDRGFAVVDFQAATFDSYFNHRIVFDTQTFTGEDQLAIVRGLLDYCQNMPDGDIGVVYDSQLSGVSRDRTYLKYDHHRVSDLIDELAEVDNGFEWRMRAFSDSDGRRVRHLQLGYPKITAGSQDLMLSSPGQILGYSLPEDGTQMSNVLQSRGATANDDLAVDSYPLLSQVWRWQSDLDNGWARLDGSTDYSTVTDFETLNAHAVADIYRYRFPIVIPQVKVVLDGTITPALIGSFTRMRIKDIWFAEGVSMRYRIVGFKVSPPERGQPETADLILEGAEDGGS